MLKVDKVFSPLGQTNYQGVRLPQIQNLVTIPKCCFRNTINTGIFSRTISKKFSFGLANSKAFPTVRLVYFQDQYQNLAISVNINLVSFSRPIPKV